jgi:hypothetical protein
MKYTLLELTQDVLSSMDSDEINSINDSVEAQQVVKVIRTAFFDIIERANLPENYGLCNLTASGDSSKPVLMTLPSVLDKIIWLQYDKRLSTDTVIKMKPVEFKPLSDFINDMHNLDATDTVNNGSFTHTIDGNTFTILYNKVVAPTYYTTFDDDTILFDSYDHLVDTTLQSVKTLAYGRKKIEFPLTDGFVPPLDDPQFPLLLNEAKSLAWAELKQAQNVKAEVSSRRGWTHLQNSKKAIDKQPFVDTLPNYGRK